MDESKVEQSHRIKSIREDGTFFGTQKKVKDWNKANAKALGKMLEGSSADDAVIIDEYETASAVWDQLKRRYIHKDQRTFCQPIHDKQALRDLLFDQESGIDGARTKRKLKEYQRTIAAADPAMSLR
ncbi:hypothetical protein E4U17_004765 [Claviceps sp. LM77 group G4]|nr:hypothetical protein E4U17_004765 [Claviceps sp. LM77 group G4]KAG6077665.1 hypothetical protein E4U33_001173 [Claviceps sp. LM78 group G4]KAG6084918.1 hypothetical protein E4U16_000702 [Claviceps sp. LM84 group G4]